jgi:lipoate-protein ligase A
MTLDLLVEPGLEPAVAIAQDRFLLREKAGALRVFAMRGDLVSLGRYHAAPAGAAGVGLFRRHSGGRAAPFGDGFIGVSLVLPHRSALAAAHDALALAPAQVMNRCVRGLLGACERLGIAAFYPGRDLVTAGGRPLAVVSFEVDAAGALLFEAIVAVERDLGLLPRLLDAVDPEGVVRAEFLAPERAASLAREAGRAPGIEEFVEALVAGTRERLGVDVEPRRLTAEERRAIEGIASEEVDERGWLRGRRHRPDLDRRPWTRTQLGVLEVHFALAGDGRIAEAMLIGDFIAGSTTVERLEAALRGCPVAEVERAVAGVLAAPDAFVLGIGPNDTIAATLRKGLEA